MSFTSRMRTALHRPSRQDSELAYLNEAASRVDLERRQREIDRGLFAPRNWLR